MKKFFGSLFIIVLALLVFVVVAKDWIIKTSIEQGVTLATGFQTHVKSVKLSLPSTIHIRGLNIRNPQGFQDKNFVDIPEIFVSVSLGEAIQGKRIHLPEVRLNIQEVRIEKNEKGVSNVELLSSVGGSGDQKQSAQKQAPAESKPAMPFLLDKLDLTVRNVSYNDRSGSAAALAIPGKKLEMDLNLQHEIFTDISDPKALVNVILMKILNSATLGKLLNIDPTALLGNNLAAVTDSGKQLLASSTDSAQKQLAGVTSQVKNLSSSAISTDKAQALIGSSTQQSKEALSGAASAAKDQVSGLLGKLKSPLAGSDDSKKV